MVRRKENSNSENNVRPTFQCTSLPVESPLTMLGFVRRLVHMQYLKERYSTIYSLD